MRIVGQPSRVKLESKRARGKHTGGKRRRQPQRTGAAAAAASAASRAPGGCGAEALLGSARARGVARRAGRWRERGEGEHAPCARDGGAGAAQARERHEVALHEPPEAATEGARRTRAPRGAPRACRARCTVIHHVTLRGVRRTQICAVRPYTRLPPRPVPMHCFASTRRAHPLRYTR